MSHINLHESAPTRFLEVGDTRLAYRQFGKEGAPPLVCLQHFTGRMDNWDPIHTNRLAQDRPVVLVDYKQLLGNLSRKDFVLISNTFAKIGQLARASVGS